MYGNSIKGRRAEFRESEALCNLLAAPLFPALLAAGEGNWDLESGTGGSRLPLSTTATRRQRLGPLEGIKIIELAAIGPVPMCAMLLADLGADVVRVDRTEPSGLGIPLDQRFEV